MPDSTGAYASTDCMWVKMAQVDLGFEGGLEVGHFGAVLFGDIF